MIPTTPASTTTPVDRSRLSPDQTGVDSAVGNLLTQHAESGVRAVVDTTETVAPPGVAPFRGAVPTSRTPASSSLSIDTPSPQGMSHRGSGRSSEDAGLCSSLPAIFHYHQGAHP